jgi:hypothetical protein
VEHTLLVEPGLRPFKQLIRKYNPELLTRIKEEVELLIKTNFIRMSRYAEWVSNIVPVEKKNKGKIRGYVDFWNLNRATPKDEYPMLMADTMINRGSSHKIISFFGWHRGIQSIFMVEEDVPKTAFRRPGFMGLFKWVVMTFVLKNAGATYQRAMNLIFHDLLGIVLEVYIDELVIKLTDFEYQLADLRLAFERMKKYNLKMNPMKCAFGVSVNKFLRFFVHEGGIEIDPKKVESIKKLEEPTCKRDVQKLLGKVNYLWRFIANMVGKVESFLSLIRLKHVSEFVWGAEQKESFERIKEYLTSPPVLQAQRTCKDLGYMWVLKSVW